MIDDDNFRRVFRQTPSVENEVDRPPSEASDAAATMVYLDDGASDSGQDVKVRAGDSSADDKVSSLADFKRRIPNQLGPYDHIEPVGRGGFGMVCRARHRELKHHVALKFVSTDNPIGARMLRDEGVAMASIDHDAVLTVNDILEHDGRPVLVLKWIDGGSIKQLIDRRSAASGDAADPDRSVIPVADATAIVIAMLGALQAIYLRSRCHFDIKPENILMNRSGSVFLADFGLSELRTMAQSGGRGGGTLRYMSWQQFDDAIRCDSRDDIYCLGLTFYELITGTLPPHRLQFAKDRSPIDPQLAYDEIRNGLGDRVDPELRETIAAMASIELEPRSLPPIEIANLLTPWAVGSDLKALASDFGNSTPPRLSERSAVDPSASASTAAASQSSDPPKRSRFAMAMVATAAFTLVVACGWLITMYVQPTRTTATDAVDQSVLTSRGSTSAIVPNDDAALAPIHPPIEVNHFWFCEQVHDGLEPLSRSMHFAQSNGNVYLFIDRLPAFYGRLVSDRRAGLRSDGGKKYDALSAGNWFGWPLIPDSTWILDNSVIYGLWLSHDRDGTVRMSLGPAAATMDAAANLPIVAAPGQLTAELRPVKTLPPGGEGQLVLDENGKFKLSGSEPFENYSPADHSKLKSLIRTHHKWGVTEELNSLPFDPDENVAPRTIP